MEGNIVSSDYFTYRKDKNNDLFWSTGHDGQVIA